MDNFVVLHESQQYGKFMMDKNDHQQPQAFQNNGAPHIRGEIDFVLSIIEKLGNDITVVDFGGNIGLFSIPIAKSIKDKNGTVITFEAQRILSYMLAGNAVLNNLTNLYVYNLAVSDKNEKIFIPDVKYDSSLDFGAVSFKNQNSTITGNIVGRNLVNTVVLDDVNLSRLDFMKIDIEGMELNALKGSENTIKKYEPVIFIEYFLSDHTLGEYLKQLSYHLFVVDVQNWLCVTDKNLSLVPSNLKEI